MKLEGKTALVTGTSPNIMGGIAEELAREGANLVCVDIREEMAQKCAAAIVAEGGQDAIGVACDVTDEDAGASPPSARQLSASAAWTSW